MRHPLATRIVPPTATAPLAAAPRFLARPGRGSGRARRSPADPHEPDRAGSAFQTVNLAAEVLGIRTHGPKPAAFRSICNRCSAKVQFRRDCKRRKRWSGCCGVASTSSTCRKPLRKRSRGVCDHVANNCARHQTRASECRADYDRTCLSRTNAPDISRAPGTRCLAPNVACAHGSGHSSDANGPSLASALTLLALTEIILRRARRGTRCGVWIEFAFSQRDNAAVFAHPENVNPLP
jgi:hypothetical protein